MFRAINRVGRSKEGFPGSNRNATEGRQRGTLKRYLDTDKGKTVPRIKGAEPVLCDIKNKQVNRRKVNQASKQVPQKEVPKRVTPQEYVLGIRNYRLGLPISLSRWHQQKI